MGDQFLSIWQDKTAEMSELAEKGVPFWHRLSEMVISTCVIKLDFLTTIPEAQ